MYRLKVGLGVILQASVFLFLCFLTYHLFKKVIGGSLTAEALIITLLGGLLILVINLAVFVASLKTMFSYFERSLTKLEEKCNKVDIISMKVGKIEVLMERVSNDVRDKKI